MNCEEATKLMDGYLDGELDPITNQTIEQHLRECQKCDEAYKTHSALIRSIGNASRLGASFSSFRLGSGRLAVQNLSSCAWRFYKTE